MTGIVRTKARIKYATHTVSVDSFWALSWIVGACARAIVLSAIAIGMASISSTNFILNNVPTKKENRHLFFWNTLNIVCLWSNKQKNKWITQTKQFSLSVENGCNRFDGLWIAKDLLRVLVDMMSASFALRPIALKSPLVALYLLCSLLILAVFISRCTFQSNH